MSLQWTRRDFIVGLAVLAGCTKKKLAPAVNSPRIGSCPADAACTVVDAHLHLFNASDLPIAGFVEHVAPVPRCLVHGATRRLQQFLHSHAPTAIAEMDRIDSLLKGEEVPAPSKSMMPDDLRDVAKRLIPKHLKSEASHVDRVVALLDSLTGYRYEMAEELVLMYPDVDLFTPAIVDYDLWSCDSKNELSFCQKRVQTDPKNCHPKSPIHEQVEVQARIADLSIAGKIGPKGKVRIHPLVGFNPMTEVLLMDAEDEYDPFGTGDPSRYTFPPEPFKDVAKLRYKSSLALLRYAVERRGFIGAKVYPPLGYLPLQNRDWMEDEHRGNQLDTVLRAFYAYCQAEQVPILTHASPSNGYDLGYGILAEPKNWEPVLSEFPRLRLNLGHFGHLVGRDDKRLTRACELWMRQAAALMTRYKHVYADVSNSELVVYEAYLEPFVRYVKELLQTHPKVLCKLMYGSDFWLNRFFPNAPSFVNAFSEHFSDENLGVSGFEAKFFGENALRFYGFAGDRFKENEENRNRLRLCTFYGDRPKPGWL